MGNQSPSSRELWVTEVVMHSPPDVRIYIERQGRVEELEMTCTLLRCLCLLVLSTVSHSLHQRIEFAQMDLDIKATLELGLFCQTTITKIKNQL